MQGGTSSSGRSYTVLVSGLYWMSWNSSFSNTTAPSVVATFPPTLNALSSVCEMRPLPMSASISAMPLARLSPLDSTSFFCASGLVTRKLDGDMASMVCWIAKRMRCLTLGAALTESAIAIMKRALSR